MCSLKRTLLVMLCGITAVVGLNTPSAGKTYYVKKCVGVKTLSGKHMTIPQYAVAKVKVEGQAEGGLVSNGLQLPDYDVGQFTEDVLSAIIIPETPLSSKPKIKKKVVIIINDKKVKIKKKYLTLKKPKSVVKTVPYNSIKSYMSYRCITASGSPQYKLQRDDAYTDSKTGVRMVDGRYCVAMGSAAATKIGTKIDLIFESGKTVHAILGDQKAGASGGWVHPDGSAVEFLVDMNALPSFPRRMGDMSVLKKFKGKIQKIRVYKK